MSARIRRALVGHLAVVAAIVLPLFAVVRSRLDELPPGMRKHVVAELATIARVEVPAPGRERAFVAEWILGLGMLAATPTTVLLLLRAALPPKKRDDDERPVPPRPTATVHPAADAPPPAPTLARAPSRRPGRRVPAPVADALSPPGLVTVCIAVPSDRRATVEDRLRAAPSLHALLAETVEHEVAAREGEALVWLALDAASADGPAPDATQALDALARRDTPRHAGGFRDAATLRSTRERGHALLAITIVARDVVLRPEDLVDRARLANAVGGLLPLEKTAVLHHAHRFVPDDAGRAFDDATLRATFPELRAV